MAPRTCFTPRAFLWFIDKNMKHWAIEACRPDDPWAMSCKTNRKKGKSYPLTERNFWPHGATFICASRHDGFVISLWSFLSWPPCGIRWLIDASPRMLRHVQTITKSTVQHILTWYKLRSVRWNTIEMFVFALLQTKSDLRENISDLTIIFFHKASICVPQKGTVPKLPFKSLGFFF